MSIILKNTTNVQGVIQLFYTDLVKPKMVTKNINVNLVNSQFAPSANSVPRATKNYPRCPVCGKATFLHHDYKYSSTYRCRNFSY